MYFILAIIAGIIAIFSPVIYYMESDQNVCNLNLPINRDFNSYYGIKHIVNPFSIYDAEKNDNGDFFETIISENMKYSSMIVVGEKGSGKTQIRQYRLKKMNGNMVPIEIYGNMGINKYLKVFLDNVKTTDENQNKITINFKKEDFMHIMLIEMVNKIYAMDLGEVVKNLEKWNFAQRLKIANIMAFYSSENIENLDIINELLHEKTNCFWYCQKIDQKKCEHEIIYKYSSKTETPDFAKIKKIFDSVKVMSNDQKYRSSHLLNCIMIKVGSYPIIFDNKNEFEEISLLANFYRHVLNKEITLVIDSLDENVYFFDSKGNAHQDVLQSFIDSIVNPEILGLALGKQPAFLVNIYVPLTSNIKFRWDRIDKIPIVKLNWTQNLLKHYADFVMSNLRNKSKNGCEKLSSFDQLFVNNSSDVILEKMRQPRDLHIFMVELIKILNEYCLNRVQPFKATVDDVAQALKNAKKHMLTFV